MVAEVVLEFFLWFLARGVKNTQEKQKPKQTAPDFLAVHFHSIYIYAVKSFGYKSNVTKQLGSMIENNAKIQTSPELQKTDWFRFQYFINNIE